MAHLIDKDALVAEIEKCYEYWREKEHNSHSIESEIRMSECQHLLLMITSLQEEPVIEDLEQAIDNYLATYWGGEKEKQDWPFLKKIAIHFAEWKKNHLWKDAQGDDLPEIDRKVVVLVQDYPDDKDHLRVAFAHRPNKYAKVWNYNLGEEQTIEIERHGKGGWNIPNVKYWLDVVFPKEMEE